MLMEEMVLVLQNSTTNVQLRHLKGVVKEYMGTTV